MWLQHMHRVHWEIRLRMGEIGWGRDMMMEKYWISLIKDEGIIKHWYKMGIKLLSIIQMHIYVKLKMKPD